MILFCCFYRVIAFLVLNIVSSAFTLCLIAPNTIGIVNTFVHWGHGHDMSSDQFLALYWSMLILGLVQAVTAIVASGFSCRAVCCCQNSKYRGTVIFAPSTNTNDHIFFSAPVALNAQTATQSDSEGMY